MQASDLAALLDRDKFAAWLASKSRRQRAGMARQHDCCPLACYLAATARLETNQYASVGPREAEIVQVAPVGHITDTCTPLPNWARQFIWRIDGGVPWDEPHPVTVARAQDVLAAITEEDDDARP